MHILTPTSLFFFFFPTKIHVSIEDGQLTPMEYDHTGSETTSVKEKNTLDKKKKNLNLE